jgi:hypothetical protein
MAPRTACGARSSRTEEVVIPGAKYIACVLLLLLIPNIAAANDEDPDRPPDWEQRLEQLRSVPYLGYTETTPEESLSGVIHHDSLRAWQGYNFYSTWATGEAYLLDMEGRLVHRWVYSPRRRSGGDYAFLLPGGKLLLINEYSQLLCLDRDSNTLWQRRMKAHHDVARTGDGSFYTIERTLSRHRKMRVWFDDLVHLSSDGEELDRWSTYEHLDELRKVLDDDSFLDIYLDSLLADLAPRSGDTTRMALPLGFGHRDLDYFHLNSVSLLGHSALCDRDARFGPTHLLICLRNVNQIAILDLESRRILWAWGEGQLEWPHHPTMLPDGHILVFDNGVYRKYSRVVEVDPLTGEIVWEYKADPPEDFYSYGRGSAQRLQNGNTLICESDQGRVFEVTPEGEVVWTWFNPLMKGDRRGTVYRMIRWPREEVAGWLGGER